MRNLLYFGAVSSVCLCGGCGDSAAPEPPNRMVYFDVEAREAVVYTAATEFPARHPVTNKPTLMPALYCARCERWRAVPPADQINRLPGAATCAQCKLPLEHDGPWPQNDLSSRADGQPID